MSLLPSFPTEIWVSDKDKYFEMVVALLSDQYEGDLSLNQLKKYSLIRSERENTQYFCQEFKKKTNFVKSFKKKKI